MHLINITLLAALASVAFGQCVQNSNDCPSGTYAEDEPELCRDLGFPPHYKYICVVDDMSFRGPSRQEMQCVRNGNECPSGTHAELEPTICQYLGYSSRFMYLCVNSGMSFRGPSLQAVLRD
ncbi:hypothetical protein EC968_003031 [Mortierella alpina]|nr:hypothetical protein EC968_003031 [Mortierella alpina]